MRIRIPNNLEMAMEMYYKNIELSSTDISELWGTKSTSTIAKLKKLDREQMAKDNILPWNAFDVNTECAYKALGMNIKELETGMINCGDFSVKMSSEEGEQCGIRSIY